MNFKKRMVVFVSLLFLSSIETWDQYKPILENIIKSIEWNAKVERNDLITRSITKLDLPK